MLTMNSGVLVTPLTSIRSSDPLYFPSADRIPEMPLNTLRSAFSNVKSPDDRRVARIVAMPRSERSRWSRSVPAEPRW